MKKMWPVIVVIQLVLILVMSVYAFVQSGIAKENLRLARQAAMHAEMNAKETIAQRQIAEKLIEELRACQSKNGK